MTPEEEALLLRLALAQGVTVPRLLIETTLSVSVSNAGETPSERRNAMVELFGIHRLLAAVSNNVNQIAKATNAAALNGTGEVHEDLVQTLRAVRRTAQRVDAAIDGLNLQ